MNRFIAASLVGLSLSAGALAAAPALAQAPAAAPAAPSVEKSPIVDLVGNPTTKAIVEKHIPQLVAHPAYDQFKEMTLRELVPLSQGALTEEILTAVQADLDKVK
ncbi:hypothetical protein [Phenylobacterium sp.]|uniref:hypothetical protein n=1 Tax=Phenylobacterium sp. TaxID=1871053 RepID=UPI00286BF66A|nr:hypothetical protein [Phenylobacterium sp.]